MADKARLRRLVAVAGVTLCAASFVFLVRAFARLDLAAPVARFETGDWVFLAGCCLAYAAMILLLVAAWRRVVDPAGALGFRDAFQVYGPAVLAKYMPGSVLQYASRQVLGARHGLGQKSMATASVIEAALHPAAALFAAVAFAALGTSGSLVAAVLGAALWKIARQPAIGAAGLQLVFFAAFGALCAGVAWTAGSSQPAVLATFFLLAWICGFLVPIAPGGIGIREAVFMVLASGAGTPETLAIVSVATRLVTTAGDAGIGAAAYCSLALSRENKQASR